MQRNNQEKNYYKITFYLFLILILIAFISLFIGKINLINVIFLIDDKNQSLELFKILFWEIRLPRTMLALLAGFSMGICGAAMQGLFRNPLADPGIIGVTASAGLGSVLVLYFGLANVIYFALPLGGIFGAAIAVLIIHLIIKKNVSILVIILSGIAINTFSSSMTSLALNLAPSPYAAYEIMFWLMGSVADRDIRDVMLIAPFAISGWFIIIYSRNWLTVLTLGEETAQSIGLNIKKYRSQMILGSALCVGSVVSITGGISFIGLVVPHLLRPLFGYNPSLLLIPSGIGGAIMLLLADIFIRSLNISPELQIGVVTAIIGAPFFIYLILYMRRVEI